LEGGDLVLVDQLRLLGFLHGNGGGFQLLRRVVQFILHLHDLLAELQNFVISGFEDFVQLDHRILKSLFVVGGSLFGPFETEHLLPDGLHRVGRGFLGFARHLG